jgi:hypothetical protein
MLSRLLVSEVSQGQLIRMHGKTSDEFQKTVSLVGQNILLGVSGTRDRCDERPGSSAGAAVSTHADETFLPSEGLDTGQFLGPEDYNHA